MIGSRRRMIRVEYTEELCELVSYKYMLLMGNTLSEYDTRDVNFAEVYTYISEQHKV